jgi:hypothetical protein
MKRAAFPVAMSLGSAVCTSAVAQAVERPEILFNRWEEDWSVLANGSVPREPLDGFKYIPLSAVDDKTYLSFGANVRERIEGNSALPSI